MAKVSIEWNTFSFSWNIWSDFIGNLDSYLCNVDSCEKKLLYGTDFSSAENTEIVKNVILESIKYFGDTVFKIMVWIF